MGMGTASVSVCFHKNIYLDPNECLLLDAFLFKDFQDILFMACCTGTQFIYVARYK